MELVLGFLSANATYLIGAALLLSEALASIPSIKSNSIFQLVVNVLKSYPKKPA